jgi:hypothetical protein
MMFIHPQELKQLQRWQRTFPHLKQGDVTLQKHKTPHDWPIAVITNVHPGPDWWSRSGTSREPSTLPKQKLAHYRLLIINYNLMSLEVEVCSGVELIVCNICVAVRLNHAISFPSAYVISPQAYDSVATRSFARPTLDVNATKWCSDRLISFEKVLKPLLTCRVLYAAIMSSFVIVAFVLRGDPTELVYVLGQKATRGS